MKGIVLIAFGKRGYAFAAHNMALSIKYHSPKVKVSVICDDLVKKNLTAKHLFDQVIDLPKEFVVKNDPAQIKTHIYKLLPYTENLYLDVDGVVLKDIQPMIDELSEKEGYYLTDVRGYGGRDEKIDYSIWASNDDIWDFFSLKNDSKLPAIQSSYCYIKKSTEAGKFFKLIEKFYKKGFPLSKLKMRWGGTLPDELLFSGTCAKVGINPQGGLKIFFGWKHVDLTKEQIKEKYYINSLYGNGVGNTLVKSQYVRWYDDLMNLYSKKTGVYAHGSNSILTDKHANG